ncbi:long-chain-fatty-acid--CoA ligase [Ornithinimicrobium ciconiae]|uniref:Long-chain-fatty-acid--CoA ligase n=1 Tax=Ornithinimicrobium ciconiae TaxID=2594265 RepID=A0A516GBE4_9MICO|nr:long-chain-fatty-acid--CoA ligase [Ornithinimicrobium ciconiae]QDO88853.1 long-chain-fatty-acid--CoA ligase [Ornithinimicrobium ciconiae]
MTVVSANHTPLSPLRFLERSSTVFPDRTAIVYGDRRSSYAEFADEVQRLARVLRATISPGDKVAFLAPNVPELLMAHFAVPLAGGVLVAMNSRLAPPEITYILEHSESTVLLVDSELVPSVAPATQSLTGLIEVVEVPDPTVDPSEVPTGVTTTTYQQFLARAEDLDPTPLPWAVDDEHTVITINYTSGTTGKPKGVMYTHRGAYLAAMGEVVHNGLNGNTKYLWTLPMFHCNGWTMPWAVTAAAGAHLCLRAVRGEAVWDAIDRLGVTHLCGAPTVCTVMVNAPEAHAVQDRELRLMVAGAPPSPTIISELSSLGINVVHVYGLTEVYGPFTIAEVQEAWDQEPAEERFRLLARQGVGMVQAETARVVDSQLQDVPADGNSMGEIVLRGNNVMLGYFKDPEATAKAFEGGWFHTGDLGVMHPDGYIQLRDRAKDIIISGGENISSVEVEQAIVSHPQILECAVVGVPDEKWGERPVAYVTVRDGTDISPEDVVAHTRALLAGYKVPREVVVVPELPKTSTGKILKYELRRGGQHG